MWIEFEGESFWKVPKLKKMGIWNFILGIILIPNSSGLFEQQHWR